jgi:Spy/CpxP family protein refolding chaperone
MRSMALAIAVSLFASPVLARRGGGGLGGGGKMGGALHPMRIDAVAVQLGVGEATLAQIKNLAFEAEQEAIGIQADARREHLKLRRLMDAEEPDEKAVMKQIDVVAAEEARMHKNRVRLLLAVRKLLTPEQRAQLQALMAERRGRGRGAGVGGQGRGPGGLGKGLGIGPGPG